MRPSSEAAIHNHIQRLHLLKRKHKRSLGFFSWLVALAVLVWVAVAAPQQSDEAGQRGINEIVRFVTAQANEVSLQDPVSRLQVGDPVFLALSDGQFRQVGSIAATNVSNPTTGSNKPEESLPDASLVTVSWYATDVSLDECQLFQHHSTGRLSEVVQTLLPPSKQRQIRQRISVAMQLHGDELSQAFVPLIEESFRKSLPVIEAEFQLSVQRHRGELDEAAERLNEQLVQERLIPLARREILPIVQKHGQPPAEKIGRQIWDRASIFRFGWRAIYDKSPLPRKDLLREEWKRFVEDEAVPVIEAHMDEIVVAIQRSMKDVTSNPAIRKELASVADEIARDPESRRLIQTILKETFVENDRLRGVWRDVWQSDDAQLAFEVASTRLEPVIREIGDEIFGSEEEGINPDFARVLRSQILRKDRRWVVAWHTGAGNEVVELASDPMPYPLVHIANE